MWASVILCSLFFFIAVSGSKKIPGRFQFVMESLYTFVRDMLIEQAGEHSKKFFPFVATLFFFILFGNSIGMIPFIGFGFTAQIANTIILAFMVFILITLVGFFRHGLKFFKLFLPDGIPLWLAPFFFVLEIISYCTRPISLAIRLFANMTAGHTAMHVFASFIIPLGLLAGWVPFGIDVVLAGFELVIVFLQAYIFTILTCIYLNDAINLH